jgi:hypothetical protein
MRTSDSEMAYLAGAIDYHAHIKRDPKTDKVHFRFRTRDKILPEYLKNTFGGSVYEHRGSPESEIFMIYEVTSDKAVDLLKSVRRLLRVQRDRVDQILDAEI